MPKRLVIAHRGHCVGAPEQTMAAYALAADVGATMIEADLRFSRDGVALMLHDADVRRTTNGIGPVADLDWSELSRLDAGSWFDPRFSAERIPRIDDLFDLAERRHVSLCVEAKGKGADNHRAALYAAREISRRGRLDLDVVASFDHRALAEAVAAFPGLRTAPDRLPERGPLIAADLIAQAHAAGASIIQHHFANLDPIVVAEVQQSGIEVWAWPPANRQEAQFAYDSGAIGLMGDDVAAIIDVIEASGN